MYNTLDLMQRHPTKPNMWRVYGRSDEQLTLSTSEKVREFTEVYRPSPSHPQTTCSIDESCPNRYGSRGFEGNPAF